MMNWKRPSYLLCWGMRPWRHLWVIWLCLGQCFLPLTHWVTRHYQQRFQRNCEEISLISYHHAREKKSLEIHRVILSLIVMLEREEVDEGAFFRWYLIFPIILTLILRSLQFHLFCLSWLTQMPSFHTCTDIALLAVALGFPPFYI